MEQKTITDGKGRNYEAYVQGDMQIIIGPPESLVDELGLPEPVATRLHNVLHKRGYLGYRNLDKGLIGALQECLLVDVQRIQEVYFKFYQEVQNDHK